MLERSRFEAELDAFEFDSATQSNRTGSLDVKAAARQNRRFARTLEWRSALSRIAGLVDLRGRSFPEAVARWQSGQGLRPDGVLGPQTWARMKPRLAEVAQRRAGGAVRPQREHENGGTRPKLDGGSLGRAFDPFLAAASVPDDVIRAVAASKAFKDLAKVISDTYVAWPDVGTADTVEAGVLVKGKTRTPVLDVAGHPSFSRFAPFGGIDNDVERDTIAIHAIPQAPAGHWVAQIALGTARAHTWIKRGKYDPATPTSNIRSAIRREWRSQVDADHIVDTVFSASKEFKGQKRPPVMEMSEESIEREMYPSELLHTGLEHCVLSEFATAVMVRKKIGEADIKKLKAEADAVVIADRALDDYLLDPLLLVHDRSTGLFAPLSEYAEERFILRLLHARWKQVGHIATASIGTLRTKREEHRDAFFQFQAKYRVP